MGSRLHWSIDGNSTNDPNYHDVEISESIDNVSVCAWSSVLTIKALPINNEKILVACILVGKNYEFKTKAASLIIKG